MLVVLRLLVRRAWLAYALATVVFVSVAMPRGELPALNLALATLSVLVLLGVLIRVGLLAAMAGLFVHSTLEASMLSWNLLTWPGNTAWLPLALVLGLGGVGLWRALAGRVPVLQVVE